MPVAYIPNRERSVLFAAKGETTEGTDSTPVGTIDTLSTVDSPHPFTPQFDSAEYRPHSTSFTRRKNIITIQQWNVTTKWWMCGPNSVGAAAHLVNGFAAQSALYCAAGAQMVVVGTTTSITFSPATTTQLVTPSPPATPQTTPMCGPATIWAAYDGSLLHKATGCWGNVVIEGSVNTGVTATFTGTGLYAAPTAATIANYAADALPRPIFRGITGTITGASTAYTPVIQSFKHDFGMTATRITDGNAATGLKRMLAGDRNPTLQLVIAMDTDSTSTEPYATLYADMAAAQTHAVTFKIGVGATTVATHTYGQAQLLKITPGVLNGYGILTLDYKLQNSVNETDWSIAYAAT